jgi:hypothetical protein
MKERTYDLRSSRAKDVALCALQFLPAAVNGELHIPGGCDGGKAEGASHAYDLATDRWPEIGPRLGRKVATHRLVAKWLDRIFPLVLEHAGGVHLQAALCSASAGKHFGKDSPKAA